MAHVEDPGAERPDTKAIPGCATRAPALGAQLFVTYYVTNFSSPFCQDHAWRLALAPHGNGGESQAGAFRVCHVIRDKRRRGLRALFFAARDYRNRPPRVGMVGRSLACVNLCREQLFLDARSGIQLSGSMNRALPMRKMMLVELNDFILKAAAEIAADAVRKKRVARVGPKVRGRTIQPGGATPLWNQLRAMIRRWLWEGGDQSALGRVLGLPRQRVHEFITTGRKLPDAERTLQLIAWLAVVRDAAPHSDVRTLRVVKRSGRAARLANSD